MVHSRTPGLLAARVYQILRELACRVAPLPSSGLPTHAGPRSLTQPGVSVASQVHQKERAVTLLLAHETEVDVLLYSFVAVPIVVLHSSMSMGQTGRPMSGGYNQIR